MNDTDTAPTEEDVRRFTFLSPMLDSAIAEMREFAKKKQDGLVSSTKIKILNRLLKDLKEILKNEESAGYLELISEAELAQNSDAVLILGQYRAALESFRIRHNRTINYRQVWITKEWLRDNEDDEEEDEYTDIDDET